MATNDGYQSLAERLRSGLGEENRVSAKLRTNERVIARVTDGIYREPSSALRELVSNAYDADARRVVIRTDAPRFERIVVEDDGIGMSPEALSHLVLNIGGSAKRTDLGRELGVTSDNKDTTASGRHLIGKLGIGLFSVSQLTRSFQIITKRAEDDFRSVAAVKLNQFSDRLGEVDQGDVFDAGIVNLWREPAPDTEEHGTTIVLTSIRPRTRETLQSADIWDAIDAPLDSEEAESAKRFIPAYHIGRVDDKSEYRTAGTSDLRNLPWKSGATGIEAFSQMVDTVWETVQDKNPNPKLAGLFDNYLQAVWELALALPLEYYNGHVFDRPVAGWADSFLLSNVPRGRPEKLESADENETIRDRLSLDDGVRADSFRVFLDNLELKRPIRFNDLPRTSNALTKPLLFVGSFEERFERFALETSAGPLKFEAYLLWNAKIAPVDHRGVLVRIHNASGSLFDETFFRYQVAEQSRLRQITAEIFVSEGLEPALNIDREGFNVAHPHMVILTKWMHNALRQLANTQKTSASVVRRARRDADAASKLGYLSSVVEEALELRGLEPESAPGVEFTTGSAEISSRPKSSQYTFDAARIWNVSDDTDFSRVPRIEVERSKALIQLLSLWGLLDDLREDEQYELVAQLVRVIGGGSGE